MAMDQMVLDQLTGMYNELANRPQRILEEISQFIRLDERSGRVEIDNREAIMDAFVRHRGRDAIWDARGFISMLEGGFITPQERQPEGDPLLNGALPWRAMGDFDTLKSLNNDQWAALGIGPGLSLTASRDAIARKFIAAPEYMFEEERISDLKDWSTRRLFLARPRDDVDPPAPDPDPGTPAPAPKPPTIPVKLTDIADVVQKGAECFIKGTWSHEVWGRPPFAISLGVRVCFDRACADKLESLLLGKASTALIPIAEAAIQAAGASAILKAAGGWIGAAFVHFALHWAIAIALNKTANGVCLIHLWPHWAALISGGAINGWGQGR